MKKVALSSVALLAALGCTSTVDLNGTRRGISGQLDTNDVSLHDARVVAASADGFVVRATVADDGRFNIKLPEGATYTLRFANSTSQDGIYDAFGYLAMRTGDGSLVRNFRLTSGKTVQLGMLTRTELKRQALTGEDDDSDTDTDGDDDSDTDSSDDGDSDSSDDDSDTDTDGTEADDDDTACDLEGGADFAPVFAQNSLLAQVDADGDGVSDDEDTDDCDSDTDGDSDGDSDTDSDTDGGTSTSTTGDDDGDSDSDSDTDGDSDSEADLMCEDAEEGMDDDCEEEGEGMPAPVPGGGECEGDCL